MDVILVLVICLALSYTFSYIFRQVGLPHILGHMVTGLILSMPFIKDLIFQDQAVQTTFMNLSDLALIFLLFFVGLKMNFHHLVKFSKKSVNISMLSAVVPFFLGFIFAHFYGFPLIVSVVLGACMSITAEAVSYSILHELNLLNTETGEIIIEAGIIDDIFEILLLAMLGAVLGNDIAGGFSEILFQILLFVGIIYIVRFFFVPFTFKMLDKKPDRSELFTASFIIVLAMAAVANQLKIGLVIGALVAGVVVKQTLLKEHKKREEYQVADMVETVTFGFLEPIFFLWIAYQADIFNNFNAGFLFLAISVTVIASLGKLIGSVSGNLIARGKESIRDNINSGLCIGLGMNARGAIELISAKIAYDKQLISQDIYGAIVFMAFVTTIISPVLFKYYASKYIKKGRPAAQIAADTTDYSP
jgi:Kef-type K+ transport system membrane component KefB